MGAMSRITNYLKNLAAEQFRRGNWPLGILLIVVLALVVGFGYLTSARIANAANDSADKVLPQVVELFASAWSWPLTPFLFALVLYVIAVIAIGFIAARLNRPATVVGDEESSESQDQHELRIVQEDMARLKQPAEWMKAMMGEDRPRLEYRVEITSYGVHGSHLRDAEPYLEFRMNVTNRTVFTVEIGASPMGGKVVWEDNDLRNQPKSAGAVSIKRGNEGAYVFQQDVLPETAQAILSAHETGRVVGLAFRHILIPLKAYYPDGILAHEVNLDLGTRSVALPKD